MSPVPWAIAIGLVFIALFIGWENHRAKVGRDALIDLTLFRVGTFSWGNLTAATVAIGEFSLMFVLPLFLVNSVGLLGLTLEVVGVGLLAWTVGAQASTWFVMLTLVVYGIGLGLASAQLTSTVLHDIPQEHSGAGSATQSTVRQLGSAFGAAIAGSALGSAMSHTIPDEVSSISGVPTKVLDKLVRATQDSAGSAITGLRNAPPGSPSVRPLGDSRDAVIHGLETGFAHAAAWSIGFSALFLVLGLLGSFMVMRQAHKQEA